jgi:hypothetical protein
MAHWQMLRARFRDAAVGAPPPPWHRPVAAARGLAIGGLVSVGFTSHPETGGDLLLIASHQGRGLVECGTGELIAHDREPDYDDGNGPDLSGTGIGVAAGIRVPLAGLYGGGLHQLTPDGWTVDVVAPDWPAERVILSHPVQSPYHRPDRGGWDVIHDERVCELRAVGFAPSGASLVIASSCTVDLFIRDA